MGRDQQNRSERICHLHLKIIHVFYLLFVVIGLSLLFNTSIILCLKNFSTTFLSFLYSIPNSPKPSELLPAPTPPPPPLPISTFSRSDQELFKRAAMVPSIQGSSLNYHTYSTHVPKVAFMFLTRGPLPLRPLWEGFFKGNQGFYSIYVHSHPCYIETLPRDSVFYGTRILSQPVFWGTATMIDAERRLLANALLDVSNQRFVLLSESCIPLFNFTTIYGHLINSNLSFIALADDPRKAGRGRYNPKMSPAINITNWRKGSQWFEVHRGLAIHIVSDQKYYTIIQQYCVPPCYSDEHYIPTLVNILYPELNSNRSLTWADWSPPRDGPHTREFGWVDITDELLNRIRFGSDCIYNGNTSTTMCFLFARKFLTTALESLLRMPPLLLDFNPFHGVDKDA